MLSLMRSLFPYWRFFEEVTEVPILYYRIRSDRGDFGEWHQAFKKLTPQLSTLIFNPDGNLRMACNSLLEYCQQELEVGNNSFRDSVSYHLVAELVRSIVKETQATGAQFQYRIALAYQGSLPEDAREIFISESESL